LLTKPDQVDPSKIWNATQALKTSKSLRSSLEISKTLTGALSMRSMVVIPNLAESTPPVTSYAGGLSWLNNQPKSFMSTYNSHHYRRKNPISLACQQTSLPFVWRTNGPWSIPIESLNSEQKQILAFTEAHNISAGISVPVHLPQGKVGSLAFFTGRKASVHLESILQDNQSSLVLAGIYLLHAYWKEHLASKRSEQVIQPLSQREQICLRLASHGLTDKLIALELGIRPSTARFHVENATRKLGATNRREASVLGARLGLLDV
jgi:LuxR family transcriptional regulator